MTQARAKLTRCVLHLQFIWINKSLTISFVQVLKGVVRAEKLHSPELFVQAILDRVKPEHLAAHYGLSSASPALPGVVCWAARADEFLELLCNKSGRLLKGGEPDVAAAAVNVINDFQRGRLPYFSPPPVVTGLQSIGRESAKAAEFVVDEGGRVEKKLKGRQGHDGGAGGRADAILGAATERSVALAGNGDAKGIIYAQDEVDEDFSALVF